MYEIIILLDIIFQLFIPFINNINGFEDLNHYLIATIDIGFNSEPEMDVEIFQLLKDPA
jgi:hypothetical protein